MIRLVALLMLSLFGSRAMAVGDAAALRAGLPPRDIVASLDSIVGRRSLAAAHVGVAVWSFDRAEWVYTRNADRLFIPASNAKVLVAAAALHTLGPAKVFNTVLSSDRPLAAGDSVVSGNLYLAGGGNPSLTTGDLIELADRLRIQGIRRVRGSLILDASQFDEDQYGWGWTWEDRPFPYCPPISAFMLNGNVVQVTVRPGNAPGQRLTVALSPKEAGIPVTVIGRTSGEKNARSRAKVERTSSGIAVKGSMGRAAQPEIVWRTVPDPAQYAGSVFLGALRDAGISVEGGMINGRTPATATVVARAPSQTVDVIVRRFLKRSDNLLGETLVKQLGVATGGRGSWSDGLAAARRALAELAGLDSTTYRMADGSGLSRYNELSPRMLVSVIIAATNSFAISSEFTAALSTAGVDGTLARRMTEDETRSFMRGKTGTLSGVTTLSGIVQSRSGERFACAVFMNSASRSVQPLRHAQDDIVRVLRNSPAR
jgi:D-alanyl-D-alanine carboxypeptidase/D-alanyl-D-alanine-endopeptidase (penicillin-binding protein 4)